jgi:hypothetical protein
MSGEATTWKSKWNRLTEAQKLQYRMKRTQSMQKTRRLRKQHGTSASEQSNTNDEMNNEARDGASTVCDPNETNSEEQPLSDPDTPPNGNAAESIGSPSAHVQEWLETVDNERANVISKRADDMTSYTNEAAFRKANYPHLQSVESLFTIIDNVEDVAWTRSLFSWFVGGYERTHRYAAYVLGMGGEGKTRVVRAMTFGMRVFECRLTEPYAFEGYDDSIDILLLDDVNWASFDITLRSTLLSIMARQPATIQRKHKPQVTVFNDKVLTVFTSNYKLPTDTAFRRRTYIVWAKTQACKDAITASEDDPGDDDTGYVNPKALSSVHTVHTATCLR